MLKLSDPVYHPDALQAMLLACSSGQEDPTLPTRNFQWRLAQFLDVPPHWVLLTNSCTAALTACYEFLAAGRSRVSRQTEGKQLVSSVLTWPGTYCYAKDPILRDVEFVPRDRSVRPWFESNQSDVYSVGVALWGRQVLAEYDVLDAAHAFGSGLDALRDGCISAVCYSFGPTKQLAAIRGGAVISPHITPEWHDYVHYGCRGRFGMRTPAGNYAMAEPNAALAMVQLEHYAEQQNKRQELLAAYNDRIGHYSLTPAGSSGHLMVLLAPTDKIRDRWAVRLGEYSIEFGRHYDLPAWVAPKEFPVAAELSRQLISLPLHCNMSVEDVERVCQCIT